MNNKIIKTVTVALAAIAGLTAMAGIVRFVDIGWQESDISDIKKNIKYRLEYNQPISCSEASTIEDPLSRFYFTKVFCERKDISDLPDYITDKEANQLVPLE